MIISYLFIFDRDSMFLYKNTVGAECAQWKQHVSLQWNMLQKLNLPIERGQSYYIMAEWEKHWRKKTTTLPENLFLVIRRLIPLFHYYVSHSELMTGASARRAEVYDDLNLLLWRAWRQTSKLHHHSAHRVVERSLGRGHEQEQQVDAVSLSHQMMISKVRTWPIRKLCC